MLVYSIEPLHAEVLMARRLAYRSRETQRAGLSLYDDTLWSEVRAVLSRRPEDIGLPAPFVPAS